MMDTTDPDSQDWMGTDDRDEQDDDRHADTGDADE